MSRLCIDILTLEQKETFESLKAFSRYGLLAGETALAIQLAHRRSYDFDLFCSEPIPQRFALKVRDEFKKIQLLVDTQDELTLITSLGVKVSFIFYPFHPLYKTFRTPSLSVYSWQDIALDKAYSIGRRGEWRDYVDLFFCIRKEFTLKGIILGARRKFKNLFSERLFLSQLCYFGDIQDYSIEFIKEKLAAEQIQRFFEKEVRKLSKIG